MDWEVKMALDLYRERVADTQRNYDLHKDLYTYHKDSDLSSRLLRRSGSLFVALGRRLQRWGGTTLNDAARAETTQQA